MVLNLKSYPKSLKQVCLTVFSNWAWRWTPEVHIWLNVRLYQNWTKYCKLSKRCKKITDFIFLAQARTVASIKSFALPRHITIITTYYFTNLNQHRKWKRYQFPISWLPTYSCTIHLSNLEINTVHFFLRLRLKLSGAQISTWAYLVCLNLMAAVSHW